MGDNINVKTTKITIKGNNIKLNNNVNNNDLIIFFNIKYLSF